MPKCFKNFDYMDDYCCYECPYSFECENSIPFGRYEFDGHYVGYREDFWDNAEYLQKILIEE